MASSSGNSSISTRFCGSEEDLQQLMDQRKRKRKQSNRESARRSRMRKQKHLDDLVTEVERLRKENNEILNGVKITTQKFLNLEVENSILRVQMSELNKRLQSLNHMLSFFNNNNNITTSTNTIATTTFGSEFYHDNNFVMNNNHHHINNMVYLNQPIMASSNHMFEW
ncbi:bZIP transcription factor 44 [Stylosanthes scabra]|uniref:BZIP transcription factor 44 n=1 Tax=Stylosanthes scabra TaxID=79078 RepID=A0ABU6Y3X0_9FABA|nr:bZIP transcription factor 44 [Stylosanthes scabra]